METSELSRVWLVTGANSGFGSRFVHFLLEKGERVVAAVRRLQTLDDLLPQDGLLKLHLDLCQPQMIGAAVQQVLAQWGRIDILVNNAGYGLAGALEELTEQQIREQMEVNFIGLALLTQAVLPTMRRRGSGYIVNISSIAGLRGFRGMSLYCASKFAVVGLTESLAQELAPFGIRVSVVEPGPYRTDWAGRSLIKSAAMQSQDPSSEYFNLNTSLDQMMSQINGQQPGDPDQLIQAIWIASMHSEPPLHMVFGDEAIQYWLDKLSRYQNLPFMGMYPHGQTEPSPIASK